jgi:undecaprenyl-diphosphatase
MNLSTGNIPSLGASLLLALIQGLTEFLPVSSSGHLAAAQLVWPNLAHPGLTLEISLHLGTTVAVLLYYRRLILALLRPTEEAPASLEGLSRRDWWTYLILGSIPTAIIGFGAQELIRGAFEDLRAIALCLALTGAILMATRWLRAANRPLSASRAIAIGTAQGAGVLPGISRSGITISLALMLGIPHRQAVTFSFLLSVPAVLGATLLDARELLHGPFPPGILFANIGFATLCSGAIGYACIGLVHRATRGNWWYRFAWYCWALAAVLGWLAR